MRNCFLPSCSSSCLLDIPLCSGPLFSRCHVLLITKQVKLKKLLGDVSHSRQFVRLDARSGRSCRATFYVRGRVAVANVQAVAFPFFRHGTPLAVQVAAPAQRRRPLRVRAAFFAAAERDLAERRLAARFACFDNALSEADLRLSR
jgi:hypothetical protein